MGWGLWLYWGTGCLLLGSLGSAVWRVGGPAVTGGELDVNGSLFGGSWDDQSPLFIARFGVSGHPVTGSY